MKDSDQPKGLSPLFDLPAAAYRRVKIEHLIVEFPDETSIRETFGLSNNLTEKLMGGFKRGEPVILHVSHPGDGAYGRSQLSLELLKKRMEEDPEFEVLFFDTEPGFLGLSPNTPTLVKFPSIGDFDGNIGTSINGLKEAWVDICDLENDRAMETRALLKNERRSRKQKVGKGRGDDRFYTPQKKPTSISNVLYNLIERSKDE